MAHQQTSSNPLKHRFTEFGKERLEITSWKLNIRNEAFNWNYLYTILHDWCVDEEWAPRDETQFPEIYYLQRDNPNFGKEVRIRWRLEKYPPGARTKLFYYMLDLDFYTLGLKDVEVPWKGQKIKLQRGEFELECSAMLVLDRGKDWEKSMFKNIKEVFIQRSLKRQFGMHKRAVYDNAFKLRDFVIQYFKLQPVLPEKEGGEFFSKRTME